MAGSEKARSKPAEERMAETNEAGNWPASSGGFAGERKPRFEPVGVTQG